MEDSQNAQLSQAQALFTVVKIGYPQYNEVADWTPAIFRDNTRRRDLYDWLEERGLKRGNAESRNDWLNPYEGLMLFKDNRVAVEAKLRFG